jgi:hypothetical protein
MAPDFVLVQGVRDTRGTLTRWNREPWAVVGPWLAGALAIAVGLLVTVWVVATVSTPDSTRLLMPGVNGPAGLDTVAHVLFRNSLVLALHAMACVAGFIAGSSLPLEAERYRGFVRVVHDKAGPLAIAFVVGATAFSLATQTYVLGNAASTLAWQFDMTPAVLLAAISLHALPELVALFLPLAAWIIASRRDDWHELLAATFVTVALATPVLILAAFVEVYVSPHVILALR